MNLENFDKTILKTLIKEVLEENPNLLKELINQILLDNDVIPLRDMEPRTKKFEMIIDDDFDSSGDVFKAIA